MSEVQSRPARGRSSARGGRGGFGSRGSRKTNGDSALSNIDTTAEQGELGELKKQYQSQLSTLKELFPDWTDADLVLALDESGGDLETTIEKISEGAVSQFAEVPKKAKDRSRSKAAKDTPVVSDATSGARASRGEGPRRGGDSVRGGRGRGTDRGRGGLRGGRGGASTGPRAATGSVPTTESPAWGAPAASEESKDVPKENGQSTETSHPHVPDVIEKPVVKVAAAAKKTWASMFAKPAPPPAVPKPAAKPAPAADQSTTPAPTELPSHEPTHDSTAHAEEAPQPPIADETTQDPSIETEDSSKITPDKIEQGATPELTLTPSKDKLTEENVEHLPDESHPPPTETAFSTVASSKDIGSAVATPLNGPTQAPIGRPAVGGYATTALKATSATPQRSASFQKRLKEQQEAVVMPGNHAVDRAAVQFGSLGLGDGADLDVDEDREEAETRTQPPQHSPVAQPRAALPPVHRQQAPQEAQQQETLPTPKQAPGLPPVPQQQNIPQQSPSNPLAAQAMQNQGSNQSYNQFGRYGQGVQNEPSAPPQKPYDPFGQQIPQSNQYDYPGQQSQAPSQPGAFSSAPDSFASQYLTSEQRSQQYQNYYGNYGQQHGQSQQDAGSAQQRTGSGFGSGPDSTFGQTQQQGQSQSRYNDAQNSGHNTPNPAASAQQGPGSQSQQMHGQQQGHAGGYPYNHPYYGSPYYANYMNQFGGYGQGGAYGSFGKGMYGQPHHYGMSPQAAFDQHSSSPANAGGFGSSSLHERGSGFGDYGRSASAASQNPTATAGSSGFGSIPESFSRPQGYSNQSSYGQQQAGQQGLGDESLKPFGDSKSGGPSPAALGAQPGRPGSATQSTPSQSAQGSLPQHSQQQGFGQYPGHLGGNNQYGGLGGLGHQNSAGHQQSGYGNYGGFGGYGGGSYNRGGWGGNYGQH